MGTPIKSISYAGYEDLLAVLNEVEQECEYIGRRIADANDIARKTRDVMTLICTRGVPRHVQPPDTDISTLTTA
jgi:hypothetical protein